MVQGVDTGGEAAVEAEYLAVNQGRQGKVVEQVGEVFPNIGISIFSQAFVIEPVHLNKYQINKTSC